MTSSIQKALSFADETKELIIRRGAISILPEIFEKYFSGRPALIVADENTFKAAGKKALDTLSKAGIKTAEPFVYDNKDLHAEDCEIDKLLARLENTNEIPIAVGAGTINDITKFTSYRAGRQYICVGTAASMDGYASTGAAIVVDGIKQTCNCPAPLAVIADMDIICQAPAELGAYGYGDLASKITAGADWILADALGLAPIKKIAWEMVQTNLRKWLGDPEGVKSGKFESVAGLFEGLVVSGLAMQYAKDSRPASGAEHLFSHIWDMRHHRFNGRSVSHGFQVGIGTLTATSMYETLFEQNVESMDIAKALTHWPASWEAFEKILQKHYPAKDCVLRIALVQVAQKYLTPDRLAGRLENLKSQWPTLREKLEKQLIPSKEFSQMLRTAGCPVKASQIGVSLENLKETMTDASNLRNRYTILDVTRELAITEICKENFGHLK